MASEAVICSESLKNWLSAEARVDPEELATDVIATRAGITDSPT